MPFPDAGRLPGERPLDQKAQAEHEGERHELGAVAKDERAQDGGRQHERQGEHAPLGDAQPGLSRPATERELSESP